MKALDGTVTGVVAALVQRGRELEARAAEAVAQQEAEWLRKASEQARNTLAEALKDCLGITIGHEEVAIEAENTEGQRAGHRVRPVVNIEGYRFSYGFSTQHDRNNGSFGLQIGRSCERECGKPLWIQITGYNDVAVRSLAALVSAPQHHQWACLQEFDGDGEPITDREGNPLPKYEPKRRVMSVDEVHDLKTDVYANLVKLRRTLQFEKALEKERAIARILAAGEAKSYTAAEKVVESDAKYAALCATLTETIGQEIRAKEELLVARAIRTGITGEPVGGPEESP